MFEFESYVVNTSFQNKLKISRGMSSCDMKWHKIGKTQFVIDRHFRFPSQKLWLIILLCIIVCCVSLSLAFLLWPFTPHHKSASGSSYVEGHCLRSFTHPSITSQAALAWPLVELSCLTFQHACRSISLFCWAVTPTSGCKFFIPVIFLGI